MALSRLSRLSAFARPEKHLTHTTVHGAVGARGWLCGGGDLALAPQVPDHVASPCSCLRLATNPIIINRPPQTVTLVGVVLALTLFCHELTWFLSSQGVAKVGESL